MVQVINDPYSGNVFGRLGKGIGQGLSEQVPKEIERSRLSSGLKKFEKESHGLSPIQQFTRLASIPGFTAEHLYTLAPLLKQQGQREEAADRANRQAQKPANQSGEPVGQEMEEPSYPEEATLAGEKRSLKSLEGTRKQLTPITGRDPQELFNEAARLSKQNPLTYPTAADALPIVQANEATRIQNLQEERNVADTADKIQQNLRGRLIATMGGEKTAKGVEGTVQTKLLRNIEDDLANPKNKLSEQQIIDKWASVGKRIAQAKTNLDARSKGGWLESASHASAGALGTAAKLVSSGYLPKRIKDTIEETRKVYHEAEADEEFQDIIAGKFDLTSAGSAYLAFPRQNKDFNSYIGNAKVPKGSNPEKTAVGAADYFKDHITDEDSILSYAMDLKKKGIDPQAFFERMRQNADAGLFTPNARQKNEFQKGYPNLPSLGDMYLFSLTNQNKLAQP